MALKIEDAKSMLIQALDYQKEGLNRQLGMQKLHSVKKAIQAEIDMQKELREFVMNNIK